MQSAIQRIELRGRGPNALSTAILTDLKAELEHAKGAPLLFTGAGEAFSAGLDLTELRTLDAEGIGNMLKVMEETTELLFGYSGPTAAAINGHAIAGGCLIALCCDVRVATSNPEARVGMPALKMGIQYPPRVLTVLRGRVPSPVLETLLLGAKRYTTADFVRMGLFDELSDDVEATARARLQERAGIRPEAYAATKRALRLGDGTSGTVDPAERFSEVVQSWVTSDLPILKQNKTETS